MLEFIYLLLTPGFFILAVLIYRDKRFNINKNTSLLISSIGLIILSIFLAIVYYGLLVIIKKFVGIILVLFGLFMIVKFPRPEEYQPTYLSNSILLIGFSLLVIGIFLILF